MDSYNYTRNKKFPFSGRMKMADVIHADFRLIPIIGRFGVNYGFGNKTVEEVCKEYDINVWFFLEIVNSYHNPMYFPAEELQNFSVKFFVNYLSNTHHYYLRTKVPEIQAYIDEMEKTVSTTNSTNIKLLNDFFKDYKKELKAHLELEESTVFPYVIELEEAYENKQAGEDLIEQIKHNSIHSYEKNHSSIDEKLNDLKNLIIKYLPPLLCKDLCQKLLTELFRLEADIDDHTRIEEKVLVPKVKLLEQKVLENSVS